MDKSELMARIKARAHHKAFETSLLVNRLHAAAIVALEGDTSEEAFVDFARKSYQAHSAEIRENTAAIEADLNETAQPLFDAIDKAVAEVAAEGSIGSDE